MNMYADSHLHMTDPGFKGIDDGAGLLFTCAASPDEWNLISAIDDKRVGKFYGTHPWYLEKYSLDSLKELLETDSSANIGEIGLDSKRGLLDVQIKPFDEQLILSKKYDRVANIHMIGCESEMLRILRKHKTTAIIHSFSGPESYIRPLTEYGCYFSVSPRILNRSADRIRALISQIPEDRLLIETDAPNSRIGMKEHIARLSEILDMESEDLERITFRNASALLP